MHTVRVRKFGSSPNTPNNGDVDMWTVTATYSYPTADATTFIVSSATNDRSGGTGAVVVEVFGVSKKGEPLTETVTPTGITSLALANQYYRVWRAYVRECGSAGTNVGNIYVKQAANPLAVIPADKGQTLMAIYTVPHYGAGQVAKLLHWHAAITRQVTATSAEIELMVRYPNEGWRVRDVLGVNTVGSSIVNSQDMEIDCPPGTDIRLYVNDTSAACNLFGGFDLEITYND